MRAVFIYPLLCKLWFFYSYASQCHHAGTAFESDVQVAFRFYASAKVDDGEVFAAIFSSVR